MCEIACVLYQSKESKGTPKRYSEVHLSLSDYGMQRDGL